MVVSSIRFIPRNNLLACCTCSRAVLVKRRSRIVWERRFSLSGDCLPRHVTRAPRFLLKYHYATRSDHFNNSLLDQIKAKRIIHVSQTEENQ
jgi:hypothetical protein